MNAMPGAAVEPIRNHQADGAYRYHLLRAAIERFQCGLDALDALQLEAVESQARRTFDLESLVVSSCEALDVVIPEQRLSSAVQELQSRYPDRDAFEADLKRNGLDEDSLRRALRRELTFDAVLQRIGAYAPPVTELEERLFYEMHPQRLGTPERRSARHILITVNDDFAENRRDAALARIERIAARLEKDGIDPFGELARVNSECPTAMQDGSLGIVTRGQLFPVLEEALFMLGEGEVSGVLESELGFHLLLCERIEPARTATFEEARMKIQEVLRRRSQREAQKDWIASLQQG
jgi:peptidyl-prolyl cis-trans isomerase C